MESFEWNWKTKDQSNMFARGWSPDGQPKGVVCLVHGLGEHVGRYEHVGAALTNAGYALLGYDLRGHGRSDGQRGHIPDFQSLMDDIADFLEQASQRYPGKPIFLYGHSLGGNLVLNYGLRVHPRINGVIASSPWLKLPVEPPASKIALAKLMVNIMPGFHNQAGWMRQLSVAFLPLLKHTSMIHWCTTRYRRNFF
jgi:acylglycerol lipase